MPTNQSQLHTSFTGILLASGTGQRFDSPLPKQFCIPSQQSLSILELSLAAIAPHAKDIIITLPSQWTQQHYVSEIKALCKRIESTQAALGIASLRFIEGGHSRQESVYLALPAVQTPWLFIHDAARPLVHSQDIEALLHETLQCKAAILAKPIADTIKLSNQNQQIVDTPARECLWAAETPQAFESELFRAACQQAQAHSWQVTDDASIMERYGYPVALVQSQYPNQKITHQEDFALLQDYYLQRFC